MRRAEQAARTKARERRIELDRDRAARDARVEQAAAAVFVEVDVRTAAEEAVVAANVRIGTGLVTLVAEGRSAEEVARLCDMEVGEVRRLLREAQRAASTLGDGVAQGEDEPVADGGRAVTDLTGAGTAVVPGDGDGSGAGVGTAAVARGDLVGAGAGGAGSAGASGRAL